MDLQTNYKCRKKTSLSMYYLNLWYIVSINLINFLLIQLLFLYKSNWMSVILWIVLCSEGHENVCISFKGRATEPTLGNTPHCHILSLDKLFLGFNSERRVQVFNFMCYYCVGMCYLYRISIGLYCTHTERDKDSLVLSCNFSRNNVCSGNSQHARKYDISFIFCNTLDFIIF